MGAGLGRHHTLVGGDSGLGLERAAWWDAMHGNDASRTLLDDYTVAFDKMMAYFR